MRTLNEIAHIILVQSLVVQCKIIIVKTVKLINQLHRLANFVQICTNLGNVLILLFKLHVGLSPKITLHWSKMQQ